MESPDDAKIVAEAIAYIKAHPRELIGRFAPGGRCKAVDKPVSLFMAGSPGAGKTEISKTFIRRFPASMPVRIDADDIRTLCNGYTGANAHLFQSAATKGVHILYDHVLEHSLNCILDGTFAYADAIKNIERSLKRGRTVELWFVYQKLTLAWEFTKAREALESRHVSKEQFISSFFAARENAISAKNHFGSDIKLNILLKDYENGHQDVYLNASSVQLDRATACGYSEEELTHLLV